MPILPLRFAIQRVGDIEVPLPSYKTAGAVGMDLHAAIAKPVRIAAGARAMIPTGYAVSIPEGYEGQIRARSGLSKNHGVTVLNGVGTIDQDFRGPIGVVLVNLNLWATGATYYDVQPGERIAQLVICPVVKIQWELVDELDDTDRGSGGFGSTGS